MKAKKKQNELNDKYRAIEIKIFEALKAHGCIARFDAEAEPATVEWMEGGFDKALHGLKNPALFGLKQKDRGVLLLLLDKENRQKTGEFLCQPLLKQCNDLRK